MKSRKLPVGGPSKRPRPANSGLEAKNHDWNDWVKAVEKYDSDIYTLLISIDRDDGSTSVKGMSARGSPG